jgi:hypothetical protein
MAPNSLHRETLEVRMIDKNNDAHDRVEHRQVAANKSRNRHRNQQSVRHKSLRLITGYLRNLTATSVPTGVDSSDSQKTNELQVKFLKGELPGVSRKGEKINLGYASVSKMIHSMHHCSVSNASLHLNLHSGRLSARGQ